MHRISRFFEEFSRWDWVMFWTMFILIVALATINVMIFVA